MTDRREKLPESRILCRRIGRPIPVSEHAECPYCFGGESDVKTGKYERFCDYQEGEDPICFGSPRR